MYAQKTSDYRKKNIYDRSLVIAPSQIRDNWFFDDSRFSPGKLDIHIMMLVVTRFMQIRHMLRRSMILLYASKRRG